MKWNNASKIAVAGVAALGITVAVSTFASQGNSRQGRIQLSVDQVAMEVGGKNVPSAREGISGVPVVARCGSGKDQQVRSLKTNGNGKAVAYDLKSNSCAASVAVPAGYKLQKAGSGTKRVQLGADKRDNITWNLVKGAQPTGSLENQAKELIPNGAPVNVTASASGEQPFKSLLFMLIDKANSKQSKCAYAESGKLYVYEGDSSSSYFSRAGGKVMSFGYRNNFLRCSSGKYEGYLGDVIESNGNYAGVEADEVKVIEDNWHTDYRFPITIQNNTPVDARIVLRPMNIPAEGHAKYYLPVSNSVAK